jgi:hypothetical protein
VDISINERIVNEHAFMQMPEKTPSNRFMGVAHSFVFLFGPFSFSAKAM